MGERKESSSGAKVIVVDETSENERLSALIRENLLAQMKQSGIREDLKEDKPVPPKKTEPELSREPENQDSPKDAVQVVNVNERILDGYDVVGMMKKAGCCTCPRCQADVRALALSLLTPQYCIGSEGSEKSFVGYYGSRHANRILAQLQIACERVKDHPRHDRES